MRTARARYADERGYVLVMLLAVMLFALAIGTAVLAETISSRQLTTHDMRVRRAQQAADAGVQQQLYDESEQNVAASYNFTGGPLALTGFVDCLVPEFNASVQLTGLYAYASSAGACPSAWSSSTGGALAPQYTALDNHDYYESEYFSNKEEVGGSGYGSVVEFPDVVALGCDSSSPSTCSTTPGPSGNAYSRELVKLAPTGPLQAIEGVGNVTINGLSALGLGAVAINGDIDAGGQLTWPTIAAAVNVSGSSIAATFAAKSFNPSNGITTAQKVTLSGYCSAGAPSATCDIERPAPITSATTCAACASGITCASCTGGGYNSGTDTFALTGGTATFAAGDYVFCNFNATGGTINTTPSSTAPVRIFILPPNLSNPSGPCYGQGSQNASTGVWTGVGNFTAIDGLNNALTGSVNGVTGALNPSGLQIYDEGDGNWDNDTSVSIGEPAGCAALCINLTSLAPQTMVVYAPTSSVNLNTGTCSVGLGATCLVGTASAFAGSVVGDNVEITATVITQDLDLGNYPLDSGSSALRPSQYVQCDASVTNLTNSLSADTGGC